MKKSLLVLSLLFAAAQSLSAGEYNSPEQWRLVWSDEFDKAGIPDTTVWSYEEGFVRNHEDQWYTSGNAYCKDGCLVIEARTADELNPMHDGESKDWRRSRERIGYTSSSLNTAGKKEFRFGRVEVRAKIPGASGAWPAIWLLGSDMEWPSCGEIDMMEYYRIGGVPHILANACWGTDRRYEAKWNSAKMPLAHFTERDSEWLDKFHIWRMDWDEDAVRLYLDDELLNEIPLSTTVNGAIGKGSNAFTGPMYLLLNLALGGDNGGEIDSTAFPMRYLVDYVRVYQKE